MRETEFRGLTKEGQWENGSLILSDNSRAFIGYIELVDEGRVTVVHYEEVLPETVGQYTQHKDRRGKKMYAGDVQRWHDATKSREEYAKDPYSYFIIKWNRREAKFDMAFGNDIEVIGNIHQNKELLEAKP